MIQKIPTGNVRILLHCVESMLHNAERQLALLCGYSKYSVYCCSREQLAQDLASLRKSLAECRDMVSNHKPD